MRTDAHRSERCRCCGTGVLRRRLHKLLGLRPVQQAARVCRGRWRSGGVRQAGRLGFPLDAHDRRCIGWRRCRVGPVRPQAVNASIRIVATPISG